MFSEFMEKLNPLCDAYSQHNRVANRLWVFVTTLTVLVIANRDTLSEINLIGIKFPPVTFYFMSCVLLSASTIAFCTNQALAHRCADIFDDLVESDGLSEMNFSNNYSWKNFAHILVLSNLNRVYPIFYGIGEKTREYSYIYFKFASDFFFGVVPLIGLSFSLSKIPFSPYWLWVIMFIISLIGAVPASILLYISYRRNCKKLSRINN